MKKNIFILFVLLAMRADAQKISYSLLAGPTLNTLRGNDLIEELHDPYYGYSVAAGIHYLIRENISVSSGLTFQRKGSRVISDTLYDNNLNYMGSGKLNNILNYMVVPITIEFREGRKIVWHAGGGMFTGFLLGSREKGSIKLANGEEINTTSNLTKHKTIDLGVTVKAGLSIPSEKRFRFRMEVKNDLGLVNISDAHIGDGGSIKTNTLSLLFGIGYRL